MNSRDKGARGEREAAAVIREHFGCAAERGVQRSGSPDSPDVKCDLPLHFEVKRVERGSVHVWMAQAVRDCGAFTPVVLHRKNRTEWLLTIRLTDVQSFATAVATTAPPPAEKVGE
jgi:Holliday junction resolvase